MELISVIVPCYNEEQAIPLFFEEMKKTAEQMGEVDFEIIFVDDGSKDRTLSVCKALCAEDPRIKYIRDRKSVV